MKSAVLKFISVLNVLLYQQVCSGETDCIRKATDLYRSLTDNSTCLSSDLVNDSINNLRKCSLECSVIDSATEDSYVRVQIKYAADIILKLERKKYSECSYSTKDLNIDCTVDQNRLGSLTSCIIGRCLYRQTVEKQPCPGIRNGTSKSLTIYIHHLIITMVIGSLLIKELMHLGD